MNEAEREALAAYEAALDARDQLEPGAARRAHARPSDPGAGAMMIHHGDCLDVMRGMEADSVDAVVTDPPAGIAFMGKAWDGDKGGRREWIAWLAERMAEALRVLKPGHMAFVWALPRTSHWTATALEDAGFEIRDIVTHVQGQGFPKSKALMKPAAEHWVLCRKPGPLRHLRIDDCRVRNNATMGYGRDVEDFSSGGASGRWPANFALSHADGCLRVGTKRVATSTGVRGRGQRAAYSDSLNASTGQVVGYASPDGTEEVAAWECAPGCPVALMDAQSAGTRACKPSKSGSHGTPRAIATYGEGLRDGSPCVRYTDTGTASRFFHCLEPDPFVYQAKASKSDRGEGNKHPTVKSVALMRHLCRLITPPGGLVLDPFCGSGSTGVACAAECLHFIGIEQDAESVETARRRLGQAQPAQLELGAA